MLGNLPRALDYFIKFAFEGRKDQKYSSSKPMMIRTTDINKKLDNAKRFGERVEEINRTLNLLFEDTNRYSDLISKIEPILAKLQETRDVDSYLKKMNSKLNPNDSLRQQLVSKLFLIDVDKVKNDTSETQKIQGDLDGDGYVSDIEAIISKRIARPKPKSPSAEGDIQSRLSKLKELEASGLITKEEAAQKRKAILDSF